MNRFKIVVGCEADFEAIWRARESYLDSVPGFIDFRLLKGTAESTHTLYASHSTWVEKEDFVSWTKSDAFRKAHRDAGAHSEVYIGHPIFEGFETVQL